MCMYAVASTELFSSQALYNYNRVILFTSSLAFTKSNDAQSCIAARSQPLGPHSLVAKSTSEEKHTQGDERLCYTLSLSQ